MTPKPQDMVIVGILAACFSLALVMQMALRHFLDESLQKYWLLTLLINLLGYSAVFVPGFLILKYTKKTSYLDKGPSPSCLAPLIRLCFYGNEDSIDDSIGREGQHGGGGPVGGSSDRKTLMQLISCFVGLQVSYLTWGLLQEKIMTKKYVDSAGNVGLFSDSQFLVFVNRVLAFAVALLYITVTKQPTHRAPIYKYSYCSFTNIMSSWCQYEALKFVSFPTQVLAKASKVIPVMLMGSLVSKKKYDMYEYVVAVLITLGMVFFLIGSEDTLSPVSKTNTDSSASQTTFSGLILLIGYITCDSFTSNWQNELFETYKISPVQAMCGVNFFSFLLTSVSLLQQGTFYKALVFMSQFPQFCFDCVILSLCSAAGNLFIYRTINLFGPVVFIIIMTLRQVIAFMLSCIYYGHIITATGLIGVAIVFGATFLRIYCGYRVRRQRRGTPAKIVALSSSAALSPSAKEEDGQSPQLQPLLRPDHL